MKINTNPHKIQEVVSRGVEEAIDKKHLEEIMGKGDKLRIKLGIDPTGADLHLGHSVVLRKLRQFQELGHQVILLIGDFTAKIGDPSMRVDARRPLTDEEVRKNMEDYTKQASKIIDINEVEIRYNSEWFGEKKMDFLMDLARRFTYARIIERDDFKKRMEQGLEVSMLELLYPLLQGYDSVALKADVEIGGSDQKFNLVFARKVQKKYGQKEEDVITLPLLIGTDGVKKMGKSCGNYIRLAEKPFKMFEQVMTIDDSLIWQYFELLTEKPMEEVRELKKLVEGGKANPKDVKMELALMIVGFYHSEQEAKAAQDEFKRVFSERLLPSEIPGVRIEEKSLNILDLLVRTKALPSKSEAKRLVTQKGVKIDGAVKDDWKESIEIKTGQTIQIGKNRFFKII